jgi:hypothetical protein
MQPNGSGSSATMLCIEKPKSHHPTSNPKPPHYQYQLALLQPTFAAASAAAAAAAAAVSNARLTGRTLVQFYLYKNCSQKQSSSVQLELNLTRSVRPNGARTPVENYTLTGGVFTSESDEYDCA